MVTSAGTTNFLWDGGLVMVAFLAAKGRGIE